jgi:hypothetical protein
MAASHPSRSTIALDRQFDGAAPDRAWMTDITYIAPGGLLLIWPL